MKKIKKKELIGIAFCFPLVSLPKDKFRSGFYLCHAFRLRLALLYIGSPNSH